MATPRTAIRSPTLAAPAFSPRNCSELLDEQIDLAVHSLKDLPTDAVMGLLLAAIPERADARDVLVSGNGKSLVSLPGQDWHR